MFGKQAIMLETENVEENFLFSTSNKSNFLMLCQCRFQIPEYTVITQFLLMCRRIFVDESAFGDRYIT